MTTFLVRCEPPEGEGPRLAVKDLIDVAGLATTSASAPLLDSDPATTDAACVAAARSSGARIVGKTNLHELAFGGSGVNPTTGTPVNPIDPTRIPGGSSSGSAVAVATGEADVAFGTDTGGSVRTPSACCGTVGLKTTYGRISLDGVRPLAPSLDTVGPMAATVAGVVRGMALLDPGFVPASEGPALFGRFRLAGVAAWVEDAIDAVLGGLDVPISAVELDGWDAADAAGSTVAFAEAAIVHGRLLAEHGDELGDEVRARLVRGASIAASELAEARSVAGPWRDELDAALDATPVIALAALMDEPAPLADPLRLDTRRPNVAVNLAGHPAIVVPVPAVPGSRFPITAVQLLAARGREDLLVTVAAQVEALVGTLRADR